MSAHADRPTTSPPATSAAPAAAVALLAFDVAALLAVLPLLGEVLGTSFTDLQWIVVAGLLPPAVLVLLGAALAAGGGARRLVVAGLVAFVVGALLCARAQTVLDLVAARAIQGAGGAVMVGAALALPGHRRPPEAGAVGAWAAAAAGVGLVMGGWLAEGPGWPMVFLVDAALGVLVAVVVVRAAVPSGEAGDRGPVDSAGAVAALAALGGLAYALVQGPADGWADPKVVAALVLAGVAGIGFLDLERSVARPLVRPESAGGRTLLTTTAPLLLLHAAGSGALLLLLLELRNVLGYEASSAALAAAPLVVVPALLMPLGERLERRAGGGRVAGPVGLMVGAVGFALLARAGPSAHPWADVLPGVGVAAVGLGVGGGVLHARASAATTRRRGGGMPAAASVDAVVRIGWLLGVAVLPAAGGAGGLRFPGGSALDSASGAVMTAAAAALLVAAVLARVSGR